MTFPAVACLALASVIIGAAPLEARQPPGDLFGVRVGDAPAAVVAHLEKVGRMTSGGSPGASGGKQIWQLDDARFAYAVVRYNGEGSVEWCTLFARKGGEAVRYADIGDPERARITGRYFYSWDGPADDARPPFTVRASGADSEVLETLSLFRSAGAGEKGGSTKQN